jgi:large subunit ribosomal protein L23
MEIIVKPVITEKFTNMGEALSQYAFVVNKNANKVQIKQAIEKMYGVSIESVNTQIYLGKVKTRNTTKGIAIGRVNKHKKAIVTLKKGEKIDFYSNI